MSFTQNSVRQGEVYEYRGADTITAYCLAGSPLCLHRFCIPVTSYPMEVPAPAFRSFCDIEFPKEPGVLDSMRACVEDLAQY